MQQNESKWFNEKVRETQASLRAYIRTLGVKTEWVDDLAQESYIIAYKKADLFDHARDFEAWIRGIARNLAMNQIRKDSRRLKIVNTEVSRVLVEMKTPESSADSQTLLKVLDDCVEKLPQKSQKLIAARYRNNQNSSVLAKLLSMTPAAVRQILLKIRKALRKCVEAQLGEGTV
jgi:RNA polymerase sigma-70 factor (ECF subfamily)